jgi:hypothetical protein
MTDDGNTLPDLIPPVGGVPLDAAARAQIAALVQRQRGANGGLMRTINALGQGVEGGLQSLPAPLRDQINTAARNALRHSYDLASRSRSGAGQKIGSDQLHKVLGGLSGGLGGLAGLPGAFMELPFATTLIFRAVLHVAISYGEDPSADETRAQCLAVFGSGGPGQADDGVDTAFVSARLGLSGSTVNALIARVAPRFAAVLSQKLAAKTVPVLGAVAGAGVNYAFVDYYVALAHVHFGLRQLARRHGEQAVVDEFHRVLVIDQT